jgi:hypothetical protein
MQNESILDPSCCPRKEVRRCFSNGVKHAGIHAVVDKCSIDKDSKEGILELAEYFNA